MKDGRARQPATDPSLEQAAISGESETALYVHFLFLAPHRLALPPPAEGVPFDFDHWLGDDMVWAVNEDPEAPEPDTPNRSSINIQLVHNVLPLRAPLDGLDTMLKAVPKLWPWFERAPEGGLDPSPLPDHEAEVSVLSVRVRQAGGVTRLDTNEQEYLEECLELAISACQDLQRAAGLASKEADPLITAPLLPLIIPCSITLHNRDGFQHRDTFMVPNPRSIQFRHFETVADVSVESMQTALAALEAGNPFIPIDDLVREAILSVRNGSYWSALIQAAAAVELLVHTLARFLTWEEGTTPEEAAAILKPSTSSMLAFTSEHLGKRLGGTWDGTVPGRVGDWSVHLIKKRNLVLHAGLPVSEDEAQQGVDAALGMVDFVKSRLVKQQVLPRFQLSAVGLMGEPGLRSRGRFTRKVQAALSDVPDFMHRFRLWREHLEQGSPPESPTMDECLLVGLYDGSANSFEYVVQHRSLLWAAQAHLTEPLSEKVQFSLDETCARLRGDGFAGVADIVLPGLRAWQRTSDWVPSYRLLPSRACLRTTDKPNSDIREKSTD